MQTMLVKPPRAAASVPVAIVSLAACPGSRRCTCKSMSPGQTTSPETSSRSPLKSFAASPPIAETFPSTTSRSATRSMLFAGSITLPPVSSTEFISSDKAKAATAKSKVKTFIKPLIDDGPLIRYSVDMSLYQHELFTLNLNKVIAVYQEPDDATVTIQTDDQRKIEVATDSSAAAAELRMEFAAKWEAAVGPLLRHGQHIFLTSAIYSIQAQGS